MNFIPFDKSKGGGSIMSVSDTELPLMPKGC